MVCRRLIITCCSFSRISSLLEERYQICPTRTMDPPGKLLVFVSHMGRRRRGQIDLCRLIGWRFRLRRHDDVPRDDLNM